MSEIILLFIMLKNYDPEDEGYEQMISELRQAVKDSGEVTGERMKLILNSLVKPVDITAISETLNRTRIRR